MAFDSFIDPVPCTTANVWNRSVSTEEIAYPCFPEMLHDLLSYAAICVNFSEWPISSVLFLVADEELEPL